MANMLIHIHSGPELENKLTLGLLVAKTGVEEGHSVNCFWLRMLCTLGIAGQKVKSWDRAPAMQTCICRRLLRQAFKLWCRECLRKPAVMMTVFSRAITHLLLCRTSLSLWPSRPIRCCVIELVVSAGITPLLSSGLIFAIGAALRHPRSPKPGRYHQPTPC